MTCLPRTVRSLNRLRPSNRTRRWQGWRWLTRRAARIICVSHLATRRGRRLVGHDHHGNRRGLAGGNNARRGQGGGHECQRGDALTQSTDGRVGAPVHHTNCVWNPRYSHNNGCHGRHGEPPGESDGDHPYHSVEYLIGPGGQRVRGQRNPLSGSHRHENRKDEGLA